MSRRPRAGKIGGKLGNQRRNRGCRRAGLRGRVVVRTVCIVLAREQGGCGRNEAGSACNMGSKGPARVPERGRVASLWDEDVDGVGVWAMYGTVPYGMLRNEIRITGLARAPVPTPTPATELQQQQKQAGGPG